MLLDVSTATRELGVGQSTLRRWIREGRLPVVRLGRRVLIRPETLEELVKSAERRSQERQTDESAPDAPNTVRQ